jgi:hypothetical protein
MRTVTASTTANSNNTRPGNWYRQEHSDITDTNGMVQVDYLSRTRHVAIGKLIIT